MVNKSKKNLLFVKFDASCSSCFMTNQTSLVDFLEHKAAFYERPEFIEHDPIRIPHRFTKKQDIELAGFFAALFSWGQRKTIIQKSNDLLERMDFAPYDFIVNHREQDLKRMISFRHRTFQPDDLFFLLSYLHEFYLNHESLEEAFLSEGQFKSVESSFIQFHHQLFNSPFALIRTKKHIATPAKQSTCKRLCMFLRWMVRSNEKGVDFGIWKRIPCSNLMIPLDIHVSRVALRLGLLLNPKNNWQQVLDLTHQLSTFDKHDPVKYDFALFNLGIEEHWK